MKLLLLLAAAALIKPAPKVKDYYPKTPGQMYHTSVRIAHEDMDSGGTGVIIKSTPNGSYILSNKHVCEGITKEWFIHYKKKKYYITKYKLSEKHDLCLVKTPANLLVRTYLSKRASKPHSTVTVSGHPYLVPHVTTRGHLSEEFNVYFDITDCWFLGCLFTDEEYEELPAVQTSIPVLAGNSGSAVFNKRGRIVGLIFANSGGFSHGIMIPWRYLQDFLSTEVKELQWKSLNQ